MRLAPALVAALALLACAPTTTNVGSLAGEWQGRIATARGHTAGRLTVLPDGRFEGTAFFDGTDRPLRGAIVVLSDGRLRYVSTEGNGTVSVDGEALRLRGDDGAIGGLFRRAGGR
jgi:hypothetical protein